MGWSDSRFVYMESLNGHEAGNGGYGQGDIYGNSPFLDHN